MLNGFVITLILLAIFIGIIIILHKTGLFDKYNMGMFGPILMLRTQKGKKLLKVLTKPEGFWKWFTNIGFILIFLAMFLMFFTLILSSIGSTMQESQPVSPKDILVIPGVNKLVPLTFGTVALIIGIIVHEFAHGILAMASKIKVKSMGVLLLVVPVGAFVEPDEEAMKNAPRKKRMRVYTAGPTMNIIIGIIFALLFSWVFMGAVTPASEGIMIRTLTKEFPAEEADMDVGMIITNMTVYNKIHTNDTIKNYNQLGFYDSGEFLGSFQGAVDPEKIGDNIGILISTESIEWINRSFQKDKGNATNGTEYPQSLDIIYYKIEKYSDFNDALSITKAGDVIDIGTYYKGELRTFTNISLANRFEYSELEEDRGDGFLGVGVQDHELMIKILNKPVRSADSAGGAAFNLLYYSIALPMDWKMMPFHSPVTDTYKVTGWLSFMSERTFWNIANGLYYIFWLNILIGTFNALPAIPLDGGFIFKDGLTSLMERGKKKKDPEKIEKRANTITVITSILVGTLILFVIIFPYMRLFLS